MSKKDENLVDGVPDRLSRAVIAKMAGLNEMLEQAKDLDESKFGWSLNKGSLFAVATALLTAIEILKQEVAELKGKVNDR